MKILYGVQGTGNGHISRASAMAKALSDYPEVEVTWLLSGRKKEKGCGGITNFIWREGLTFIAKEGRISILSTILENNIFRYIKDVLTLDLSPYDIIVCDYEPVVALAAKLKGKKVIGIGHQYAFYYDVPKKSSASISYFFMTHFAPSNVPVGLHWSQYDKSILPPIIDLHIPQIMPDIVDNKVIVYFPFESIEAIQSTLQNIKGFDFYIYHPDCEPSDIGHLHFRAISRSGFKHDLLTCKKVIVNSGFELISECLYLGKQILTKPLHGQIEQYSNAKALSDLGYANVMNDLDEAVVNAWLEKNNEAALVFFPDVAKALAKWLASGCQQTIPSLSSELWGQTEVKHKIN
jgi:uncharacterized protein (TIGR00661 family)